MFHTLDVTDLVAGPSMSWPRPERAGIRLRQRPIDGDRKIDHRGSRQSRGFGQDSPGTLWTLANAPAVPYTASICQRRTGPEMKGTKTSKGPSFLGPDDAAILSRLAHHIRSAVVS